LRRRRSKSQEKSRSATNESTSNHIDKEDSIPAIVVTGSGGEPITEDSISIPEAENATTNDDLNAAVEDSIPVPQESNSIPETEATAGDKPIDDSTSEENKSDNAPSDETGTDLPAETTENKEPIPSPQDPIPTDSTNTTNEHVSKTAEESVKDSEPAKNETNAES
jgi:hypothetical protein